MSTIAYAIMQISLVTTAGGPQPYDVAYKAAQETGRPLVVLVGADWCPGCQTMKQSVIPQLQRRGTLSGVAFTAINYDQDERLAGRLMSGQSIPQLIVYVKTDEGWRRSQMTGPKTPEEVEAFITHASNRPIARLGQR